MRRGYTKFTIQDFEDHPVWELQGSLTMAEPYGGKIPFKADPARAYFVKTSFKLADKTVMPGWTMICVPPYELDSLSPTILTAKGPVDLTKLAGKPKLKDVQAAYQRLGRSSEKVFPLQFETVVTVPKGPAKGVMAGFIHRLAYEDENGWSQHQNFCYKTIKDLETAIQKYQEYEAAKKAALEPSKDEKALFKAASSGDLKRVAALIAKGVNINRGGVVEEKGYTRKKVTPLMVASEAGYLQIVQALLDGGADVHLTEESNNPVTGKRTAVACACLRGQLEVVRILLKAGADPNHRLSYGHTILDEACGEADIKLIRVLLESGGNPNASCGQGNYFALERAAISNRPEVVELLLTFKADINGADDDDETTLIKASRLLRPEMVSLLLRRGADVKKTTLGKLTALHRAIITASDLNPEYDEDAGKKFSASMEIVNALIKSGSDINAKTKSGERPVTLAKDCCFPELMAFLKHKGARD